MLHHGWRFEAGSPDTWETVEKFLRERSGKELPDQVHIIWYDSICSRFIQNLLHILLIGYAYRPLAKGREWSRLVTKSSSRLLGNVRSMRIPTFHPRLTHIQVKIPVIIVFTKYDMIFWEQEIINEEEHGGRLSEAEILKNTETCFNNRIREFKAKQASIVKVSTPKDYPRLFSYFPSHRPEIS